MNEHIVPKIPNKLNNNDSINIVIIVSSIFSSFHPFHSSSFHSLQRWGGGGDGNMENTSSLHFVKVRGGEHISFFENSEGDSKLLRRLRKKKIST